MNRDRGPLAIVAGRGNMPFEVADSALQRGRAVHIFALKGFAEPAVSRYPHTWLGMGELGRLMRTMRREGCRDLVIIGPVNRPDLKKLRIDFGAIMALPTILGLMRGGDDTLLGKIVQFFETKGFRVVGAHDVAPDLVAGVGVLGAHKPSPEDIRDIQRARDVVAALGRFDVGQGAVVAREHVLAVEAAEGTDRMLERCAGLHKWGRRKVGVFFKGPKPGQEMRVDMPTIGCTTVELVAKAGLAGIALEEGGVLIAERPATIAAADAAGLFIVGVEGKKTSDGDRGSTALPFPE